MKRFYRIISAFALLGAFAACQEVEESLGMPELNLSTLELKFGPEVESQQFTFVATRDWSAVPAVDWVSVYPDSGSSSPDPQTVTVTVLANDEYDRSGIVAVDIKMMAMDITVTQSGAKGDPAKLVLYHNDFDKETAADPWPYTDASDVWKNETGSGIDELSYASSKVSVRSNSNSNGSYSNYKDAASGANNLFFAASGYLALEKIALGGNTAIALSFGSERYLYGASDNTFVHSEFPVYVSVDKEKWVPVEYSFPNGDVSGIWDVATARFTVPEGSEYLYIYFAPTIGSAYRLDDLDIKVDVSGEESATLDFANGIEITYGSSQGGGNDNPGGGDTGDVISATVAQFNAAAESQTQVYELVGTIGGSINTTYGNFDLTDETGTVYVYGLTATNLGYGAKNDKSYASLGLAAGDKIKIRGYRGSFNDKIEVLNAWFIEKVTDQGGGNDQPGGGDTGDVISATVAQFNAAAESQTQVYELVGTIGGSINTTYGNFDLTDETGTVYVYGLTATNLGYGAKNDKSYASLGLAAGDKIKIRGYRGSFNDKIEVLNAWFIEKVTDQGGGNDNPGGGDTGDVISATVAQFNAAAESETQVYELVGTIGGSINTTYGNFDLTDETGTVYVYGLTATNLGYGAKNDKSYASLGLAAGDKIKIRGYRGSFNDKIEVLNAWFIEKVTGQGGGNDQPGGGNDNPGGGAVDPATIIANGDFASNVTWTGVDKFYAQKAKFNGSSTETDVLKLGTSSAAGSVTFTVPAGTKKITMFAVAWSGKTGTINITAENANIGTVSPASNSGASGNPTYTITLAATDYYEVEYNFTSETKVTLASTSSGPRVIIARLKTE